MRAIVVAAIGFLCLLTAPAFAALPAWRSDCPNLAPISDFVVARDAQALAALDSTKPVKLWLGPDRFDGFNRFDRLNRLAIDPAALIRLTLLPGSVLMAVEALNADLRGLKAAGVNFVDVDLRGAQLRAADLSISCFEHTLLDEADLSSANLTHAVLDGNGLNGTILSNANLQNAVLTCAYLIVYEFCGPTGAGVKLDRARLVDTDLAAVYEVYGGDLSGALIENSLFVVDEEILNNLAAANVTSVWLRPSARRSGPPIFFTKSDLDQLRTMLGKSKMLRISELTDPQGVTFPPCPTGTPLPYGQRACDATMAAAQKFPAKPSASILDLIPEQGRVYTTNRLVLPSSLRENPLAQRILAAHGTSDERVELKRRGDAIDLSAISLSGENGHQCHYEGLLTLEPATGEWRNPTENDGISWVITSDEVDIRGSQEDLFPTCGARAGWNGPYFFTQ